MKAVIIGATGATGKELLDLLLADNAVTEVVALVRKPLRIEHPKLNAVVVDFDKLDEWATYISGDVAFSCLGTTLKVAGSKAAQYKVDYDYQYQFAKLAKTSKIPTFVLVSSSTANPKSLIFYSKMKGKLEEAVEALGFESFNFFRPGPLVRPNTDRIGEKIGVSVMGFLSSLGVLKSMEPLPVKSLAALMLRYAKNPKVGKTILEASQILNEVK